MRFLFGSCNMFSVRNLRTELYLADFLGCLMSLNNRNGSPGGSEEDLVQHKDFWILRVSVNIFVSVLEMSLERCPGLHILSTQGPSTCTYDCLGLGLYSLA